MAFPDATRMSLPPRHKGWPLFMPEMPVTPPPEEEIEQNEFLKFDTKTFAPTLCDSGMLTPPAEEIVERDLFPIRSSEQLASRIVDSDIIVAVIGVGYVGEHLATAFSTAYNVIAFDISEQRIQEIQDSFRDKAVQCTTDPHHLTQATHFLIAVSTLVTHQQEIDTRYLKAAISTIERYAQPGSTVVVESSVAVGMTRELLEPLMISKSLKCGMSPERVDPGRTWPRYSNIPKLVSGLDIDSLRSICDLYARVFNQIVPVSSTEVAEMTKLYENCQRMMCIAYANEMADACRQLSESLSSKAKDVSLDRYPPTSINIDPYEVARAAATKPFGYQSYTPSLGVGGHCIPVNPYYLLSNANFPLLEACTKRMRERPAAVGDRIMSSLEFPTNLHRRRRFVEEDHASRRTTNPHRRIERPHVLMVGMGFKRGQSVLSHSPGYELAKHLLACYDVYVEFADPLVQQEAIPGIPRLDETVDWNIANLQEFDAIVIAVDQPGLDFTLIDEVQRLGVHVESFSGPRCSWTSL